MDDLIYFSARRLSQLIRNKEVSSEIVVKAFLDHIEKINPRLNAVVQLRTNSALEEARAADADLEHGRLRGPLHGVPITVKDSFEVSGIPCTGGTQGRASYIPQQDASTVAFMRSAGAIVLGKTNVPDLCLAFETDNLVYGRTNNPYDFSRTCGGSSGGEGAIIAAGGSPLGLASDAGGSIRLPAHFCGIAGIKPTSGRIPMTGHFPPAAGLVRAFWQFGPMARHVEDLTLALTLLCQPDGIDPFVVPAPLGDPRSIDLKQLRIAFHVDNGIAAPTAETADAVRKAAWCLTEAGSAVEEATPRGIEQSSDLWWRLVAIAGTVLPHLMKAAGTRELHPLVQKFSDLGALTARNPEEMALLVVRWDGFRTEMLQFLRNFDVILSPAAAVPAVPHGSSVDQLEVFSYLMTYNLTGWPVAVVRCGTSPEGLPIGVQVIARPWREDIVLAVAQQLETALGGWLPPPP